MKYINYNYNRLNGLSLLYKCDNLNDHLEVLWKEISTTMDNRSLAHYIKFYYLSIYDDLLKFGPFYLNLSRNDIINAAYNRTLGQYINSDDIINDCYIPGISTNKLLCTLKITFSVLENEDSKDFKHVFMNYNIHEKELIKSNLNSREFIKFTHKNFDKCGLNLTNLHYVEIDIKYIFRLGKNR